MAQSSIYSLLGLERMIDLTYNGENYNFNATYIDLQQEEITPTPTDIWNSL